LSLFYAGNQIFQCEEQLITSNDVPNIEISLRTGSTQNLLTGGQGFICCSCKTKYITGKCKCKQKYILSYPYNEMCLLIFFNSLN
jgi:hypothetical protein